MLQRRNFLKALAVPLAAAPSGRQRQFTVGLYSLPHVPDPWREVSEAGVNVVNAGKAGQLDVAHEHGLGAWLATSADPAKIRQTVAAAKNNPALLFWETEDEPTFVWKKPEAVRVSPERIIAAYRLIKSLDPQRPVYLNHSPTNLVGTLQRYNAGADIVATDVYPVIPHGIREQYALWPGGRQGDLLNTHISQVGDYTDKMRRVAGPERAVFMVLQAFAWENLRGKDRDPRMVLYPTRSQIRFMTWQAIIHGVEGVVYWGLSSNPPGAPVWGDLKAVLAELRQYRAELAAPPSKLPLKLEYHDTGHSLDRGIEWAARGRLLACVNADPNPVDVSIRGLRTSVVRERFAPFDVRLFKLEL
ncbi:MAG TPA: hypothetical protein VN442_10865 [Bryobacteraceae bacterium]|nr:hypothetical protein [Bryobacteraceae bacterium]